MKLVNTFDAITITTSITSKQMEKAKRYNSNCLTLIDDKKQPVFGITTGRVGSACKHGIVFEGTAPDGTLYVTLTQPGFGSSNPEEAKAHLEDEFGMILYNLKLVEEQVTIAIGATDTAIATVQDAIVIQ